MNELKDNNTNSETDLKFPQINNG